MNTARKGTAGSGTQPAALVFGGQLDSSPFASLDATEEWDGTNWTAGGALSTARLGLAGFGIQTATLAVSGQAYPSPTTADVESYNGSSWTSAPSIINGRRNRPGGAGTTTAALVFGGIVDPGGSNSTKTEGYDGTSWSTRPNLGTARYGLGSASPGTACLAFGGGTPPGPQVTATEEFTGETTAANITDFTTS